jgi:hypothetical protein
MSYQAKIKRYFQILQLIEKSKYPTSAEMLDKMSETGIFKRQYNETKTRDPSFKININHFIIDLKKYKRQYIAVTNSKGEKEVWVNCFCNTWRKNW